MPTRLSCLVPEVNDLLALEVEELADVLLVHLNSYREGESSTMQHGKISPGNFLGDWHRSPDYGGQRKEEVRRALMEAWAWLQREAFLVESEPGSNWFFMSRRGQRLKSREDVQAYRHANALPRHNLHPVIANRVYPAYLRGEYDTAVFQAFREVEVAVRTAGAFPPDMVGVQLMRAAFRPVNEKAAQGPLTDIELPAAEQEAMAGLFAGAIGLYKNPQSHRHVPTGPVDAAEVIGLASQLLRLVESRSGKWLILATPKTVDLTSSSPGLSLN